MDTKIFGFVGIESYDLIYYAANLIQNLGCNVILIDASEKRDKSLMHIVHCDFEDNSIYKFKDISFVSTSAVAALNFDNYDYAFVYYGKVKDTIKLVCDELYLVTDYQMHNLELLRQFCMTEVCKFILVRDRSYCNFSEKYLLEEFPELGLRTEDIFAVEDTDADVSTRLLLHHSASVKLNKISKSVKVFIFHLFDVDFTLKQMESAWKKITRR